MTDSILNPSGVIMPDGNYDGGRLIITNRVTKLMIDTILERRVIVYRVLAYKRQCPSSGLIIDQGKSNIC